ncbi:hypothetical protein N7450_000820 [Penicillium hetheringtonii]|uniref:Uncharacterized protein n=1 Tax=Penicillium hetheringtonii TaxID=911720 RepID=A0AAD6E2S7_9EURO|nr:hypothetical protein N7450_000820 [Penicillium hetheringtonii]
MGYTHYFGVNNPESPEWKTAWPQLIQDVSKIIEASHVRICGPSPDDDDNIVTPPIVDIKDGIDINGVRKSGYEPFRLGADKWGQGNGGHFCKTSQKAYDEVVTCILLRAWKLAPK